MSSRHLLVLFVSCASAVSAANEAPTEAEIASELGEIFSSDLQAPQPSATTAPPATLRFVEISVDGLFAAGASSVRDAPLAGLQAGSHDPQRRGFTLQNLELSMLGAVDPYLSGEVHLIFQIDAEGESLLEVEEVFVVSQALPLGLQLKAGSFFTEFGRHNPQHPHAWHFADQPVVLSRLLGGDGLRNPGARISWLSPLPWWSEIILALQNANGETAHSFLGAAEEEEFAGVGFVDRPTVSLGELLISARWLNSWSWSPSAAMNFGFSAATGPNRTGETNRTHLVGADLFFKWQPTGNYHGWPFVIVQAEGIARRYELGAFQAPMDDWGVYGQTIWAFRHPWTLGMRYGFSDGEGLPDESVSDRRHRSSAALTYYASEFSKLRVQYNYDIADHLRVSSAHAVWLQLEFLLGSHGAHAF